MTTLMKGFQVGVYMNGGRVYGVGRRPNDVAGCKKETKGSAADRAQNSWFDHVCLADPGVNVHGNEPTTDPSLEEPGMANWDLDVIKTFPFTADGRFA